MEQSKIIDTLETYHVFIEQRGGAGDIKVGTTNQGAPGPPGVRRWVVPPRGTPLVLFRPKLFLLVQKNSPESFAAFGLRLVLIFCKVKNKQKQQLALGIMSIG